MKELERFLKYISIDTTSNSRSGFVPSTPNQKLLAKLLVEELKVLEIDEVYYDEKHCYVYALLKGDESKPKVGFISHLDTSENACGKDIKPNIIKEYNGNDIKLNNDVVISVIENPDLKKHIGKTLITSDGTTLLGADDKAGITEIMSMLEYFKGSNENHGDIYICFTPDEELGMGTEYFDFSKFKADVCYTVDGIDLGEISYENFNAATARIKINGISTHCGNAKGKMINSILLANAINNSLPDEIPSNTDGYDGFFHLVEINGNVSNTTMRYLIRDFDFDSFNKRKDILYTIVSRLNEKYNNCIKLQIIDSYYNMKQKVDKKIIVVENVKKAINKIGIEPIITPIRGGTDGAELTEKGLVCPNIGTGGHNFHSVREYIALEDMEKTSKILIEIIREYSKENIQNKTIIKKI